LTDLKNAAKQVILWLFKEALGPVVGVGALFALSTISVTHFLGPSSQQISSSRLGNIGHSRGVLDLRDGD